MTRLVAAPLPVLFASALTLGAFLSPSHVFAAPLVPTAIFASADSSAPSLVPGETAQNFLSFNRATFSADGTRWALPARTNTGNNNTDVVIIRGSGFTGTGSSVVLREGTVTGLGTDIFYGAISDQIAINNSGQFAANLTLDDYNGNTTGPIVTANNGVLVRGNGSALEIIAREGEQAIGAPAGTNYGATTDGQTLLNNGNLRFRNFVSATNQYLVEASAAGVGTVLSQSGNTPAGQLVAPAQAVTAFGGTTRFVSDGTGTNTLYSATLAGATATNSVVVFNSGVVAQLGVALPGNTSLSANVFSLDGLLSISGSGGNYLLRGSVNDGTSAATRSDFVLGNTALVAKTGDAIFVGSSENWNDDVTGTNSTFFASSVNSFGQTLIGGYTTASVDSNEVLVFGSNVILREGDAVDLNGDGLLNDNAYIDRFFTDNLTLTDTGLAYVSVGLRNTLAAGGASVGSAFVVKSVAGAAVVPEAGTLPLIATGLSLFGMGLRTVRRKR